MYQLTCIDCNMKYVGQRGRPLRVRYREHFRDFKFGNGNSKFAQNLIEHKHSIGPIDKITHTFHFVNKGSMLDTLEKDHIYRITNLGSQINDRNTVVHNILFDTIPIEGIPNSQFYHILLTCVSHSPTIGQITAERPVCHYKLLYCKLQRILYIYIYSTLN